MARARLETDVLVVGAGVAGLATALRLSEAGCRSVAVIERDGRLGGHASGRNAGMIRQAVEDPCLAHLAREGRLALAREARRGWKQLRYRTSGSLFLGADDSALETIRRSAASAGVRCVRLDRAGAERRVGALRGARFSRALWCPSDAMVDIQALLGGLARRLADRGVPLWLGRPVDGLVRVSDGFRVRTGSGQIRCRRLVNAAGAWAGRLGRMAGAARVPLTAYRRHLFHSPTFPSGAEAWPFVWDLTHELYFRPLHGRRLLLSPCDKTPARLEGGASRTAESVNPAMGRLLRGKLERAVPALAGVRLESPRAGLRTMTPDGRFAIGEDADCPGFYWVAGLGGHGVTTCLSVGRLASRIVMGRPVDRALAKMLSPRRFS